MLDLTKYQSIGAALKDALDQFAAEVCLIEADRERENERLTYAEFKRRAHPLARALQDAGFGLGDRASIIMTNQSKWLISAYAIFYSGGILVPLDYKLSPDEQWQLLKHSGAKVLITEYPIWRQLSSASGRTLATDIQTVLITEAPANADLSGATRWETFRSDAEPVFRPRERKDVACIVYSSGTGGRPKGCMMTHENYLEQCVALTSLYPFSPGVRYLSILPTNHAIDFMVGFFGPFTAGASSNSDPFRAASTTGGGAVIRLGVRSSTFGLRGISGALTRFFGGSATLSVLLAACRVGVGFSSHRGSITTSASSIAAIVANSGALPGTWRRSADPT